jgi:hypothetical protein
MKTENQQNELNLEELEARLEMEAVTPADGGTTPISTCHFD